jgi:hypothetical protein
MHAGFPAPVPAPPPAPPEARILAPRAALAYFDARGALLPARVTALEAWNRAMARPLPGLGLAFRLRDAISARFGVKRIGGFTGRPRETVSAGDRLDFFLVEEATPTRLLLSERDRHLDVLTCITATPEGARTRVTITSSVRTHNLFGRIYMLPVGPAHKLIVHLLLRRLARA